MEVIKIEGGHALSGRVRIDSAKNSTVALIPAAILGEAPIILEQTPSIADVNQLCELIHQLNGTTQLTGDQLMIDPSSLTNTPLTEGAVTKLRASYYFMGALLGKFKEATVGLPGGCYLGPRPIDLHLKGFKALGATISQEGSIITLKAEELVGTTIPLDFPSVGATINIMLAAVKAKGLTRIQNAAKEPEIVDVADLLIQMGAKIDGAGTDEIRIEGVEALQGATHTIIPDRIEAGTYIALAAAAGTEVEVENIVPDHLEALFDHLREMDVDFEIRPSSVLVRGKKAIRSTNLTTGTYPALATDLQQPLATLLTQASGSGCLTDTIYADRFKNCLELNKMGAQINVHQNSAQIQGPAMLKGTRVMATDLRAGASLVIAGLLADGVTEIGNTYHIDRGYSNLEKKLTALGAKIWRETVQEQ